MELESLVPIAPCPLPGAAEFQRYITPEEGMAVAGIVKTLETFMPNYTNQFLVAGVGGILRRQRPEQPKDIDLAVVGLKYTSRPDDHRSHSFDDVIRFTETVQAYFKGLTAGMLEMSGSDNVADLFKRGSKFRRGSGPFGGIDNQYQIARGEKPMVTLTSELESFSQWGSKGLQVCLQGIRPIDVQFVFNKTPEEWMAYQEKQNLPYEILLMKETFPKK